LNPSESGLFDDFDWNKIPAMKPNDSEHTSDFTGNHYNRHALSNSMPQTSNSYGWKPNDSEHTSDFTGNQYNDHALSNSMPQMNNSYGRQIDQNLSSNETNSHKWTSDVRAPQYEPSTSEVVQNRSSHVEIQGTNNDAYVHSKFGQEAGFTSERPSYPPMSLSLPLTSGASFSQPDQNLSHSVNLPVHDHYSTNNVYPHLNNANPDFNVDLKSHATEYTSVISDNKHDHTPDYQYQDRHMNNDSDIGAQLKSSIPEGDEEPHWINQAKQRKYSMRPSEIFKTSEHLEDFFSQMKDDDDEATNLKNPNGRRKSVIRQKRMSAYSQNNRMSICSRMSIASHDKFSDSNSVMNFIDGILGPEETARENLGDDNFHDSMTSEMMESFQSMNFQLPADNDIEKS